MAKTLEQIQEGLAEKYSGPSFKKDDNTYIPWNEAVKVANKVFGIDGYSVEIREAHKEGDGYAATVRVVVQSSDDSTFYRDGQGLNELSYTKEKKFIRDGQEVVIPSRPMTDTAIKGAASDATNRALKLFGSAFGLDLYDKSDAQHMGGGATGATGEGNGNGRAFSGPCDPGEAASEKQLETLRKAGATHDQLVGLTKGAASALIDQVKANGWKMPGTPTRNEVTASRGAHRPKTMTTRMCSRPQRKGCGVMGEAGSPFPRGEGGRGVRSAREARQPKRIWYQDLTKRRGQIGSYPIRPRRFVVLLWVSPRAPVLLRPLPTLGRGLGG